MNRKRQTRKGEEAGSHLPSLRANASSLIIQIQRFSDLVLTCGEARGGSGLENLVEEMYVLPEAPTFLATNKRPDPPAPPPPHPHNILDIKDLDTRRDDRELEF